MKASLRLSSLLTLFLLAAWPSPAPAMDPPAAAEAAPEGAALHMAQVCAGDLREELGRRFSAEALQALALPLECIVKDRRTAAGLYTLQCGLLERLRGLPEGAARSSLVKALELNEERLRSLFRREAVLSIPMAEYIFQTELRALHSGGGKRTAEAQGRLVWELRGICLGLASGWDQVAHWVPWTRWRAAFGMERLASLEELTVGWQPVSGMLLPCYLRRVLPGEEEADACPREILAHPTLGRLTFADAEWREQEAAVNARIPLAWLAPPADPASPAPAARKPGGKDREAKRKARLREVEDQNRQRNLERRQAAQARKAEEEAARLAMLEAGRAEKARRAEQSRRDRERARAAQEESKAPAAGQAPDPAALPLEPAPGEDLNAFRESDRYRSAFKALQDHPELFAAWQDALLARHLGRRPETVRPGPGREPRDRDEAARDLLIPIGY